jgi:hypothetical protein
MDYALVEKDWTPSPTQHRPIHAGSAWYVLGCGIVLQDTREHEWEDGARPAIILSSVY